MTQYFYLGLKIPNVKYFTNSCDSYNQTNKKCEVYQDIKKSHLT